MSRLRTLALSSLLIAFILVGCQPDGTTETDIMDVPQWAQEAIWYQIWVERFENGDPTNDQTLSDIDGSWPHLAPEGFKTTRWTQDWFEQEDWAKATGEPFYLTVQSRRYGGDLQGIIDRIDYLEDLGVNAIYINPINDSPSLHKYDARTYRHIDRNFGPDPVGDLELISQENPVDPSTWVDTAADTQFFELVDLFHERGMKVILDVSWNHTGITFWAWQDILENQSESPYADWYRIEQLDDPDTEENEFSYRGWAGVAELPELRKTGVPEGFDGGAVEGNLNEGAKAHIFNVTRKWMDPNGDGDPSDGIDGFRLDVAEKVPLGFWRDYREFVRSINPEAYLVGEIWWEEWPHRMFEPHPWIGNTFDAIMHYRWYMPTRSLFANADPFLTPSEWTAHIDSVQAGLPDENLRSFMNLTASHDSPRFTTSLANPHLYKWEMSRRDNPDLNVSKPGSDIVRTQKLIMLQQFSWIGSPHVWNGDELGMWGADDPDNRKPLMWPDKQFDDESASPDDVQRSPDPVEADVELLEFYRSMIAFRTRHADLLNYGSTSWSHVSDDDRTVGHVREHEGRTMQVVFNLSEEPRSISLPEGETAFQVGEVESQDSTEQGENTLVLGPRSGIAILY